MTRILYSVCREKKGGNSEEKCAKWEYAEYDAMTPALLLHSQCVHVVGNIVIIKDGVIWLAVRSVRSFPFKIEGEETVEMASRGGGVGIIAKDFAIDKFRAAAERVHSAEACSM